MSDRNSPERRERLANAIDVADQLRALAAHPDIERWFKDQEKAWIEEVLSATDEPTRAAAVARVHAIRSLCGYMAHVEIASNEARRKLKSLDEVH